MLLELYLTIFEQSTMFRMALKRVYPLQSSIFDAGRLLSCGTFAENWVRDCTRACSLLFCFRKLACLPNLQRTILRSYQ